MQTHRHGVVKESPRKPKDQQRNLANAETHSRSGVRSEALLGKGRHMMNAPARLLGFRRGLSDWKAF